MKLFLTALALLLVIEGVVWALFPNSLKSALKMLDQFSVQSLRFLGLALAVVGAVILYILRLYMV